LPYPSDEIVPSGDNGTEVTAHGFDGWPDADKVGLAMLASTELGLRTRKNRFSSVLRATATIDEKTRWKWVRCLKLAFSEEIGPDKLQSFILDEHGGINGCAAAWVSNVGN
jgi:hypothetical protein